MQINSKHLWWIIPLFLIIGWTIGFYFNIPNNITIDYGDNVLGAIDDLKKISYNLASRNATCNYYGMPATQNEKLACMMGSEHLWESLFGEQYQLAKGINGQDVFQHDAYIYCDEMYFDR